MSLTDVINFFQNPEIVLAGVLVLIVIFMLLAARAKTIPVKGFFYLLATGFGVFGIWFFKNRFSNKLMKEIRELEDRIAKKEKELVLLKEKADVSEAEYRKAIDEWTMQKEALQKQILILKADTDKQVDDIYKASDPDTSAWFDEYLSSLKK